MEKASSQTIYTLLTELGIPWKGHRHETASSMEELAAVEAVLGAHICKNLFLCNRQGTEFYLLLIRGDKRFRTAEVSKRLGKSRLSFGTEDKLYELLGVHPGAITPMGLIFDKKHQVQLIVDQDLMALDQICFHPCVNTETIRLSKEEVFGRFFPYTGHTPQLIEITGIAPGEESPT